MIRLIPRVKPYYSIDELLASLNFFLKNQTKIFEEEFSRKFGVKYALFLPYGRVALYIFFKAIGIVGGEVICPAFTCNTVAQAIVLSGNIPVFVDCDDKNFNMNIDLIERNITKRTVAVVAAHMFGYPMDVVSLRKLVNEKEKRFGKKIYIVQDLAQSFGATWKGNLPTAFGDVSIFSLGVSKIINSITGGILATNDEKIYKTVRKVTTKLFKKGDYAFTFKKFLRFIAYFSLLRDSTYFVVDFLERLNFLSPFKKYYREDVLEFPADWNILPSELQARIGRVQLKKYDNIVMKKKERAKRWMEMLKDTDIYFFPYNSEATYSRLVGLSERRDFWIKYFRKEGVQLGTVNYLLPNMEAFKAYAKGEYPTALKYNQQNIIFPT